jgi:hypothetical protein
MPNPVLKSVPNPVLDPVPRAAPTPERRPADRRWDQWRADGGAERAAERR